MTDYPADGSTHDDITFKNEDWNNAHIDRVTFRDCTFVDCDLSNATLRECRLLNCKFMDCTLKLMAFDGTTAARLWCERCNLLGVVWTNLAADRFAAGELRLRFEQCNLSYAIFMGLQLPAIKIQGCNAQEANFGECDMSDAALQDTNFSDAVFHGTNLEKANFSGATNYHIPYETNRLKGAKFTLPEAVGLLYGLDVEITDS